MSTPLRLLVIGCGGIAGSWLPTLTTHAGVRVIGLCDLDPDRAEGRRREYALADAAVGSDPAAMIDALRPDAVVDLTIPDAHERIACLALGKGCHVLAEKPMAADMPGAKRILAAAEAAGRIHAVMQNRRYMPQTIRFRDAIASRIGALAEIHVDFFIGAHFGGFRDAMEHVLLLDMAIHTIDQARFLTGLDPVAVNAVEWTPPGSWYRHGASAMACVELTGGIRFTYRGSWCSEGANTSWEAAWRAIGTAGSVLWDRESVAVHAVKPWRSGQFSAETLPPEDAPPAPPMAHTGHAGCIHEMIDALRTGGKPQTAGADNIKSLAVIHAAIASATRGGARVTIDEMLG